MAEIVVCEFMDEAIANEVLTDFDVLFDPGLVDNREALLETLEQARAIIVRNRTQVNAELLDRAPQLQVVGRLGVGLDNIDLELCKSRDIAVYPATGANDRAVAEYAVSAALLLLRGVWQSGPAVIDGGWPRTTSIGREAFGKSLGLVGFGSIARQVAGLSNALGMKVRAYDPYLPDDDTGWSAAIPASLEDIARNCDVISIHVPLNDETRNLVDSGFIGRMKKGAVLINTARGGVVDEDALIEALRAGCLGGAALDVYETEPVGAARGSSFASIPNLLLTPHIAGITEESNVRVSQVTAENVARHLQSAR